MGYISYIIAVEELARVDGSQAATIAAGNSLGIGPIYYFGSEEQRQEWLPKLCAGQNAGGLRAHRTGAGSDAGSSRTKAELKGDSWVINGSKIFITNSANPLTGVIIVQAITGVKEDGKREISCLIVPKGAPGFTAREMKKKMMWRSSNTGELFFEECPVPTKIFWGKGEMDFTRCWPPWTEGGSPSGPWGWGGAQGAFEMALHYANTRVQFGRPISSFQVNAFKLADMALEVELARNLLYKACWLRENNRPFSKEAAMAKLYCSEVMGRVCHHAVQLHGGYGLMKEYKSSVFTGTINSWRSARALRKFNGS